MNQNFEDKLKKSISSYIISKVDENILQEENNSFNVGIIKWWGSMKGNSEEYTRTLINDPRTFKLMQQENSKLKLNWNATFLSLLFYKRELIEEVLRDKLGDRRIETIIKDINTFMKAVDNYYIVSPDRPNLKSPERKVYIYSSSSSGKVYIITKIYKTAIEAQKAANKIVKALALRTFAGEKLHSFVIEGESEYIDWLAELK